MNALRLGLLREGQNPSLSPRIFEWALGVAELQGTYDLFDLSGDAVEQKLRSPDWDGLNVTVPHKTRAYELCSHATAHAAAAGAVNTLSRRDGAVWGDNSDVFGFSFALERVLAGRTIQSALILGTGGAGRAAAVALKQLANPVEIAVATRHPDRSFDGVLGDVPAMSYEDARERLVEFDVIVQATPVGSARISGCPLKLPLRAQSGALAFEMIYAPDRTAFLNAAAEAGMIIENGLIMLVAQAMESFRVWTGVQIPMQRAMAELLPVLQANDPISYRG